MSCLLTCRLSWDEVRMTNMRNKFASIISPPRIRTDKFRKLKTNISFSIFYDVRLEEDSIQLHVGWQKVWFNTESLRWIRIDQDIAKLFFLFNSIQSGILKHTKYKITTCNSAFLLQRSCQCRWNANAVFDFYPYFRESLKWN